MSGAIVRPGAKVVDPEIVDTDASVDYQCAMACAIHCTRHATFCRNMVISDPVWIGAGSTVFETPITDDVFIAADATVVGDVGQVNASGAGVPASISCE